MTVVKLVMKRLDIGSKAELARLCGVTRTCPREWETRKDGKIPTRHHAFLVMEARRRGAALSFEELNGL